MHDASNGPSAKSDFVFAAMAWLSLAVISCWMGWLLVTGCSASGVSDQRPIELSAPASRPVAAPRAPAPGRAQAPARGEGPVDEAPAAPDAPTGSLQAATRRLSSVAGVQVALAPGAERIARCAVVETVVPGEGEVERLRAAIEAAGLRVVEGPSGVTVGPDPDVLFLGCSAGRHARPVSAREVRTLERQVHLVSRLERELPREAFIAIDRLARTSEADDRVVPYYREGEMIGVKVYAPRGYGLASVLGFGEGDVITHVAGQALTSPGQGVRIAADLDKAVVRVLREGRAVELEFRFGRSASPRALD